MCYYQTPANNWQTSTSFLFQDKLETGLSRTPTSLAQVHNFSSAQVLYYVSLRYQSRAKQGLSRTQIYSYIVLDQKFGIDPEKYISPKIDFAELRKH